MNLKCKSHIILTTLAFLIVCTVSQTYAFDLSGIYAGGTLNSGTTFHVQSGDTLTITGNTILQAPLSVHENASLILDSGVTLDVEPKTPYEGYLRIYGEFNCDGTLNLSSAPSTQGAVLPRAHLYVTGGTVNVRAGGSIFNGLHRKVLIRYVSAYKC